MGVLDRPFQTVVFHRPMNEPGKRYVALCRQAGPEDSFDLTGKTGSFFYMAPEVVNEQRYNEKACLFEKSGPASAVR